MKLSPVYEYLRDYDDGLLDTLDEAVLKYGRPAFDILLAEGLKTGAFSETLIKRWRKARDNQGV